MIYVLSNLGTPSAATDSAVAAFLKEFLYDPAVIPLPPVLRYPLVHWLIAPRRAKKSAEKYRQIWLPEGSPLLIWSRALQKEVQKGLNAPVLLGMRYGEPSLGAAIDTAIKEKAARVVLVPLYPQFAEATSGSTIAYFKELADAKGYEGRISVFPAFPRAAFFTKPLADSIRPHLKPQSHLLLTFHGLPEKQLNSRHCNPDYSCCERSISENISCYRAHCLATAQETARLLGLGPDRWTISFQSRFGRDKWIRPHTEDLLKTFPASGKRDLVVAAPSFVADCLETNEELGIQARDIFLRAGGERFELVPCLNGDAAFARGLAEAMATANA
ncbi:MAG: ferrochelatase [Bdellovibrionota bacterium]